MAGGKECSGSSVLTKPCNEDPCPPDANDESSS